jgi:hypothetical protein
MEVLNAKWDTLKQRWIDENGEWDISHPRVSAGIIEHIDTSFSKSVLLVYLYRCGKKDSIVFLISAKRLGNLSVGDRCIVTLIPTTYGTSREHSPFLSCIDII